MSEAAPIIATIGGRLKEERLRLGLGMVDFSTLAGVTRGALVKWENGRAYPNAAALAALSTTGADVLYILTGRCEGLRRDPPESPELTTAKAALAALEPVDRRQLVFELLFGGSGR